MSGASLEGADLSRANLRGADLQGANLRGAILVETNLEGCDLSRCKIFGISAWDVRLTGARQHDLLITGNDQPAITVDEIEVGQFIYFLLNNEKIRSVIDTIGKKGVLLLGRFSNDRKVVLESPED